MSNILADTFRTTLKCQTVAIERFATNPDGTHFYDCGTGFVHLPEENEVQIFTAAHVVKDTPPGRTKWKIRRLRKTPGGDSVVFNHFQTERPIAELSQVVRPDEWAEREPLVETAGYDIAALNISNEASDYDGNPVPQQRFFDPNEGRLLCDPRSNASVLEAIPLAWCGYPVFMWSIFRPLVPLCYYEGVVSSVMKPQSAPPFFVVDGNSSFGVSGGPAIAEVGGVPKIVGMFTRYHWHQSGMPGLCIFVPVQNLFDLTKAN